MQRARETEAKFAAPADLRLPRRWDLEGVVAAPSKRLRLTTHYFDTNDFRLARSGASLRHRAGEGWTVKLPEGTNEGALVRTEHRFPGRAAKPPAEALDLVRAYVRGAGIEPVATMRTVRTAIPFLDARGREIAELVDDRVSVGDGPTAGERFREIEIELRDGTEAGLIDRMADRLGPVERHMRPKLVRALGPAAEEAPDVAHREVSGGATAEDVIAAAIAASVARLIEHDPGARLGTDPESVHQCRVAIRRLRSDLRTFAPLLDEGWVNELRSELRWLGETFGGVRDADVLLDHLRRRALTLPDRLRRPAERLLRRLRREHDERRAAMLEDLRGERYVALLDRLVEAARSPALTAGGAEAALTVLPGLAAEPWRRLRSAMEKMPEEPGDEDLHRLRIRTKRARYAAEAVEGIGGRPIARFAKAAARLQDVLGIHQDAVVADEWLRDAVARSAGPVAFTAGALSSAGWAEAGDARREWPRAWKRLVKRVPEGWA